ncbi:Arabinanase/levansucrase/invertase [Rhizodiscina lignyota]|uniref:Arabinanase/levansucrase/invertase n=1 Tax=Rhizodiscina lignyota TaxID=1504668 RepID=A0A9P4M1S9_9PEZI|nr:Arabinanase/levansucrase/invertase [Rhizodiscina lignyota]
MLSSLFFLISSLFALQAYGLGGRPYLTVRQQKTESFSPNDTFTHGPVIAESFADPSIIKVGSTWWAFATSHDDINIQVATSPDFQDWTKLDGFDALPTAGLPSWIDHNAPITWAPDVNVLDDGSYLMYFSAATTKAVGGGLHCIGAATSKTVKGPYSPLNTTIACPIDQGGAIDAAGFKDWDQKGQGWGYQGGQRYVVYKIDGNTKGHGGACGNTVQPIVATPIVLLKVAADGVTTQGESVVIFDNIGAPDQGIVEAPNIVKAPNGNYILFYSSGCFATVNYTQGYAVADKLTGPYTRQPALYQSGDIVDGRALNGPGGGSCYWDAHHFLFHSGNPDSHNRGLWEALIDVIGDQIADGIPRNGSII